jgi:large conductance mechanosensitive channel
MQSPIPIGQPAWLRACKASILRGDGIGLAVGMVSGAACTATASSLVADVIHPVIGLLVGGISLPVMLVVLMDERRSSMEATRHGEAPLVTIGMFATAIAQFLIVALAISWLMKAADRIHPKAGASPKGPRPPGVLPPGRRDAPTARRPG